MSTWNKQTKWYNRSTHYYYHHNQLFVFWFHTNQCFNLILKQTNRVFHRHKYPKQVSSADERAFAFSVISWCESYRLMSAVSPKSNGSSSSDANMSHGERCLQNKWTDRLLFVRYFSIHICKITRVCYVCYTLSSQIVFTYCTRQQCNLILLNFRFKFVA